jgi:hypothetical protein
VEKNGRSVGRIRLRRVDDVSAASLLSFVKDAVTPGTEVHTDGWRAYSRLKHAGYQRQVTVIDGGSSPAHEVMPAIICSRIALSSPRSAGCRVGPAPYSNIINDRGSSHKKRV